MTSSPTSRVESLPERLAEIRNVLRNEYMKEHNHPWILAYSGGKDSTLLLQCVWEVIVDMHPADRNRSVLVVGNDTLVESPPVIQHLKKSLKLINDAAVQEQLPISTKITEPCIDHTYWVNVVGRGYIPPTRNFRWCTDRMKILPTNRLIQQMTQQANGSILLIGTRRAESHSRQRAMTKRNVSLYNMNPHSSIKGCSIFAPIGDLTDDDVWLTILQRKPPWGGSHRNLITLYRNAGGGECPLVVTKEQAPSCGTSSPRFGCWTCTVVKKDRSLRGLIDSGTTRDELMEALYNFREWLIELRENTNNRLPVRRDGNIKQRHDGSTIFGPFKIQVRKRILRRLKSLEAEFGITLISNAEIDCIHDEWWRDEIRENARLAFNNGL